jgi:hypothetical protein
MASSISHFKAGWPARATFLLATAVAAWGLCIFISLKCNPLVRVYAQGMAIKDQWADKMTREHGAKALVYGGSSCAFSIDGERALERYHLPLVNYGNNAGYGAAILTETVLGRCHPGDTLIVALEPQLLADPVVMQPEGVQFCFMMHHPEWATHPVLGVARENWFEALSALRPGGYITFTFLTKIATHRPLTRYRLTDYHASGWEQTDVRLKIAGPANHDPHLSPTGQELLRNLRAWCDQRKVRVAYSLPWSYTPPEKEREFKLSNIDFLLQISHFMPVLKDPQLGANTNSDLYADTVWHLTTPGAQLRTDSLAEAITNWDVWTPEELRALENN